MEKRNICPTAYTVDDDDCQGLKNDYPRSNPKIEEEREREKLD